jgi:magnesium transporter
MLAILKTTPTGLKRLEEFEPAPGSIVVSPTEEELELVSRELGDPARFAQRSSGRGGEIANRRGGRDDSRHCGHPHLGAGRGSDGYDTIPLGMLLHPDYFITTCLRPNPILGEFERDAVRSFATFWKTRFLLQILQRVSAFYLRYLGRVDRETEKLERELRASMKNEEIFQLLGLQKALVYFTTSLHSNEAVLQKLLRSKSIRMYEEDEDLLEDVIVENKQASEMAKIYTDTLTAMMDAFTSVISNNLNGVNEISYVGDDPSFRFRRLLLRSTV